jgi:glucose/mannose-6-phosphate isomerase
MLGKIRSLPEQLRLGFRLGEEAWRSLERIEPKTLAIAGMGASAIGGDLLRIYLSRHSGIPVFVLRDYGLPRFVGEGSLVVISSYSGNTEEALSCFREAISRNALVVCITSDGHLLEEARLRGIPYVKIPMGFPPRAGLGYCFATLLALAWKAGLCAHPEDELCECADTLESLTKVYVRHETDANPAVRLARDLVSRIPLIYCGTDLDAVGLRWKNQFCENAKTLAFTSVVPEANHNEIMGWEVEARGITAGVIVLRTSDEHPQAARSLALIKDVIGDNAFFCGEFWTSGSSLLSRMFSLILLGDYGSVYLALARGVDPTPIKTIDRIKTLLKQGGMED